MQFFQYNINLIFKIKRNNNNSAYFNAISSAKNLCIGGMLIVLFLHNFLSKVSIGTRSRTYHFWSSLGQTKQRQQYCPETMEKPDEKKFPEKLIEYSSKMLLNDYNYYITFKATKINIFTSKKTNNLYHIRECIKYYFIKNINNKTTWRFPKFCN